MISFFRRPFRGVPNVPLNDPIALADLREGGGPSRGYVAPNSIAQTGNDESGSSLGSLVNRACHASRYLIAAGVSALASAGWWSSADVIEMSSGAWVGDGHLNVDRPWRSPTMSARSRIWGTPNMCGDRRENSIA